MTLRLFGIPVVFESGVLWLAGLYFLLGVQGSDPLVENLATILVLFSSILWHELGHAFTIQALGLGPAHITIHGFGGLTRHRGGTAPQELAVSLAGPGAGLLLGFMALAVAMFAPLRGAADHVVDTLATVNLFWSMFNLMPVFPMDGGNALARVLQMVAPALAGPLVFGLGLVGGVGIILLALWFSSMGSFAALFLFILGAQILWLNGKALLGR